MATLKNTTIDDSGFLQLPRGTTAERPASPSAGMLRFNTTFGLAELFNGANWVDPGSGTLISDIGKTRAFPGRSAKQIQNVVGNSAGWFYIDVFRDGNPQ